MHLVTRRALPSGLLLVVLFALAPSPAFGEGAGASAATLTPTSMTVTNTSSQPVYANLVLGQPPVTPPPNCSNLGEQIKSLNDSRLVFHSSVAGKTVQFTTPVGVDDKGSYQMDAGETITYLPQLDCGGTCSPALTFNFFFTAGANAFAANNGCSNTTYPDATNLAEGSINFGVNGSVGSGCANADDTDISAVNGVNAVLAINTSGSGWPAATSKAKNGPLGSNANSPGVFGWAATNCSGPEANAGYPNPSAVCAAPVEAPQLPSGQTLCSTPGGTTYQPIVAPDGTKYCDQRSDAGTCNNQRSGGVTGGTVEVEFVSFTDAPA